MPEIVGAFSTLEGGKEGASGVADTCTGALGEFAHVRLEFAVGHLDRVKVGRTAAGSATLRRLPQSPRPRRLLYERAGDPSQRCRLA
jgi:hypothetical protein